MNDKIFDMYQQRISNLFRSENEKIYCDYVLLTSAYAVSDDVVPFVEKGALTYKAAHEGDSWGHTWQSGWLHVSSLIPDHFAGRELCLRIHTGSEAMLFDEDGVPLGSFTDQSAFDHSYYKDRFILDKQFLAGEKLDYWIELAANGQFGVHLPGAYALEPKEPLGTYNAAFKYLRLCIFNRELWSFLLDMKIASGLLDAYGKKDYRAKQLLYKLNEAIDIYQYIPENASKARRYLAEKVFSMHAAGSALSAYTIGHAHIDVAWLWPVRESIRKAARTFSSQLTLMKRYPDYVFGASQPQLYSMVKDNYPELYAQIKERVREGRWEAQGGMWVEADANIISGESMTRQFLHGKNFFMDEFGIDSKIHWLPDVFGYSAAMPQFIKKSGCDYFMTQKLSWSKINVFPHHTFRWIGVDGTEVLTHFLPEATYNADGTAQQRVKAQNDFQEGGFLPAFLSLVGIGDGGGGPKEEHLEGCLRMRDLEGCPKSVFKPAAELFNVLEPYRSKLSQWHGELYLELHRGTLTTQARNKRSNRKCEQYLTALEFLCSCFPMQDYPLQWLDKAWKNVLLNQFHDIIPGSSIHQVYEVSSREYDAILKQIPQLAKELARRNLPHHDGTAVVVNTLPCQWSGVIELPEGWNNACAADQDGNILPCQEEDGKTFAFLTIPPSSIMTVHKSGKGAAKATSLCGAVLENELIRYEFDGTGQLLSAYDKTLRREMLSAPGNVLSVYHDRPMGYADAWDIEIYYPKDFKENLHCTSIGNCISGAARSYIDFSYCGEKCTLTQRVVLLPGSKRLDFITDVYWNEHRAMLRTSFPVNVSSEHATYDIQYSFVKRPTFDNTSWDEAKFEVCGQRYADLSSDNLGVALLNDCKYGYRVKGSTLDLNLLRSPSYPDYRADLGRHQFTYSLLPHEGDCISGKVQADAAQLNRNPFLIDGVCDNGVRPPCKAISESVTMEVIKKAEKDDSLIVRLVETHGKHGSAILQLRDDFVVSETNLIEWSHGEALPVKDAQVQLDFTPFEIKTLRLEHKIDLGTESVT